MTRTSRQSLVTAIAAHTSIILFFVMALEVMIMISPFAFFFYSVFSPFFNFLSSYPATAWLTTFFLPHMILPPTLLLQSIRIAGSVFFVVGSVAFIVSALQIYLGKIFKWGIAERGLYRVIRHPQYLSLALWGIGMAILWPRFIVLVSLSCMFVLYYYLAKHEERRMLNAYGESYAKYMFRTGRFLPQFFERLLPIFPRVIANSPWRHLYIPVATVVVMVGMGFLIRTITLQSLHFQTSDNVSLLSILPEDNLVEGTIAQAISAERDGALSYLKPDKDYLGYVMPPDYIMQGMIANTGSDFHLFKKHNTFAMISDWVLHPFEHLRRSPSIHMAKMHNVDPVIARRHHCPLSKDDQGLDCANCPYRRVIVVEVDNTEGIHLRGKETLAINSPRVPVAFFDINTLTGKIVGSKAVEPATAWAEVPTPAI